MLAIRLSRIGRKNRPSFRLIVSEKSKDTFGDSLEILGFHDPLLDKTDLKKDRILYWMSKGAKPSPTVHNLFVDKNIIQAKKVVASKKKKKSSEEPAQKAEIPVSDSGEKPKP